MSVEFSRVPFSWVQWNFPQAEKKSRLQIQANMGTMGLLARTVARAKLRHTRQTVQILNVCRRPHNDLRGGPILYVLIVTIV